MYVIPSTKKLYSECSTHQPFFSRLYYHLNIDYRCVVRLPNLPIDVKIVKT